MSVRVQRICGTRSGLKSGESCLLAKSQLDGADLKSLKPGASTKAFVTGVDVRGLLLLSKAMPE